MGLPPGMDVRSSLADACKRQPKGSHHQCDHPKSGSSFESTAALKPKRSLCELSEATSRTTQKSKRKDSFRFDFVVVFNAQCWVISCMMRLHLSLVPTIPSSIRSLLHSLHPSPRPCRLPLMCAVRAVSARGSVHGAPITLADAAINHHSPESAARTSCGPTGTAGATCPITAQS